MKTSLPPDVIQITPEINFTNFNPLGQADYFNCRIEGVLVPKYTEKYTFYATHDDGFRMRLNGISLMNNWEGVGSHSATKELIANETIPIVIESYEATGTQKLIIEWQSASQARQIIGTTAGTVYFETNFTTCDKSLSQCKERLNHLRFGGFPHIPRSRDPREIWVRS